MNKKLKNSVPNFLFVEILDPDINGLFYGLRNEFSEKKFHSNIHLTIRGPYKNPIPEKSIQKINAQLENDSILFHGIGMFENPDCNIVYIQVSSDHLEKVCWKPDYPKGQYGCTPHVSLYVGNDMELAKRIKKFLVSEDIRLISDEFQLSQYALEQNEFFPGEKLQKSSNFQNLVNSGSVSPNILQRASNLVTEYQKSKLGDTASVNQGTCHKGENNPKKSKTPPLPSERQGL